MFTFDPFNADGFAIGHIKINPYGAALDPEIADHALKATDDELAKIVAMIRRHDLGADSLPTVVRMYEHQLAAHSADVLRKRFESDAEVTPIVLRSTKRGETGASEDVRCRRGQTMSIGEVNPHVAVQVIDISIQNGKDWKVYSVTIGNKHQTPFQTMRGDGFQRDIFAKALKLDPWLPRMDLSLVVEYDGDDPDGGVFEANLLVRRWRQLPEPVLALAT